MTTKFTFSDTVVASILLLLKCQVVPQSITSKVILAPKMNGHESLFCLFHFRNRLSRFCRPQASRLQKSQNAGTSICPGNAKASGQLGKGPGKGVYTLQGKRLHRRFGRLAVLGRCAAGRKAIPACILIDLCFAVCRSPVFPSATFRHGLLKLVHFTRKKPTCKSLSNPLVISFLSLLKRMNPGLHRLTSSKRKLHENVIFPRRKATGLLFLCISIYHLPSPIFLFSTCLLHQEF